MDKGELLQDSVKKLLSLGVSDEEIAESLSEVGVTKKDAQKMIVDVRSGAVQTKSANPDKTFETTAKALGDSRKIAHKQPMQSESGDELEPSREINPLDVDFGIEMQEASNGADEEMEEQPDDIAGQIAEQNAPQVKTTPNPVITPNRTVRSVKEKVREIVPKLVVPGITPVEEESNDPNVIADKILEEVSKSKAASTPATAPAETITVVEKAKEKKEAPRLSDVKQSDVEEMWKRGIVIAINTKLDEMRKLKDDIDDEVDSKVDRAVKKETGQFKVLLDSQKDLIISSNREALGEKQKEVSFIIDSKIAELKKYNREIEENMRLIQQTKVDQERVMKELNETMVSVKRTKTTLVMEMNSELIKSKSQAQDFVDKSEKHIKEMDERINKTLELEKNIAEGMLEKAEQKIESMTLEKADDLIQELQVELNKIKAVEKSVSIETLDDKIKTLDKFKSEFLNSMQGSLTKINDAIERLNDKNANVEMELKGRMLIFDAKIEELTKFEKEFGKTMEIYLAKNDLENKK